MNKVVYPLIVAVGILSALLLYLAGVGYRNGVLELGQAFALMRYCALGGITGAGLSIFYLLWQRPLGAKLGLIFVSALLGLVAFYLPYRQLLLAQQVPPIHDISTDTVNPPAFVAIAPLRATAPNPAAYDGPEVARQQLEAYPDLMPREFPVPPARVFAAAEALVKSQGWELVAADASQGRIEATVTTRWFGFKDDVVIRLKPGPADSTLFDMRSKSRIGRSDIGTNAGRIRAFIKQLQASLAG